MEIGDEEKNVQSTLSFFSSTSKFPLKSTSSNVIESKLIFFFSYINISWTINTSSSSNISFLLFLQNRFNKFSLHFLIIFTRIGVCRRSPYSSRPCRYPGHSLSRRVWPQRPKLRPLERRSEGALGAVEPTSFRTPDKCNSRSMVMRTSQLIRKVEQTVNNSSRPIGRLRQNRQVLAARKPADPEG